MSQRKKNSVIFSKKLSKSEVNDNYFLGLKKEFCETHLPRRDDANIVFLDENGREYNVRYVRKQYRFQRGWRDFVFAHDLLEGDTIVLERIDDCKFKVRITRGSESVANKFGINKPWDFDEDEGLIEENACRQIVTRKRYPVTCDCSNQIQHRSKQQANVGNKHSMPQTKLAVMDASSNFLTNKHMAALNRIKELEMQLDVSNGKGHQILESDDESVEEMVDKILRRARKRVFEDKDLAESTKHVCIRSKSTEAGCATGVNDMHFSAHSFKDVKSFGDFKIQVNGETLDSKIPITVRKKYYQLCCCQKEFIHGSIMKGLDGKLVIAMILSIVNIAEAMKDSSIWTSRDDLECKEKTLKSFEDLGMLVGSLRAKIGSLIKISREHSVAEEKLKQERKVIKEKKAEIDKLEENVIVMNERKEKLRFVFEEVAGSSW